MKRGPYKPRYVDKRLAKARKKFKYQLSEWLPLKDLEPMVANLTEHKYPYIIVEDAFSQFAIFTQGKKLVKEKKRYNTPTIAFEKTSYKK